MAIAESISAIKSLLELAARLVTHINTKLQQRDSKGLAKRFLRLHREHGVLPIQIPRVLGIEGQLKPNDVLNLGRLLEQLDNEMLRATCELYGVRREWLDGEDVSPYTSPSFYKDPRAFVTFMNNLTAKHGTLRLWCFKSTDVPLEEVDNDDLYAVIVADNFLLGERMIERYYPIHSDWPWHHQPARLDFKAMVFICWHFKIYAVGRNAPAAEIKKVRDGINFPSSLYRYQSTKRWHPGDYIFTAEESQVARDSDEALVLRGWLEEGGVLELLRS
jgi:hypothetical protein